MTCIENYWLLVKVETFVSFLNILLYWFWRILYYKIHPKNIIHVFECPSMTSMTRNGLDQTCHATFMSIPIIIPCCVCTACALKRDGVNSLLFPWTQNPLHAQLSSFPILQFCSINSRVFLSKICYHYFDTIQQCHFHWNLLMSVNRSVKFSLRYDVTICTILLMVWELWSDRL